MCDYEACEKESVYRNFCSAHYQKLRKQGYFKENPIPKKFCSIDGCEGKYKGKGYCVNHLRAFRKYGDPLADHSLDRKTKAFLKSALESNTDDCIDWPYSRGSSGYGNMYLNGNLTTVHRIVCEVINGPPLEGMQCLHSCHRGTSGCINPRHLRWGTRQENMQDKIDSGRSGKGSKNSRSILSEEQVLEIKRHLQSGKGPTEISRLYSVSAGTIQSIKCGDNWGWLNLPEQSCSKKCNDN